MGVSGFIVTPDQLKSQVLTKFFGGSNPDHIPQLLEWGHSRNFEPKIQVTGMWLCIADNLSHTCAETKKGFYYSFIE